MQVKHFLLSIAVCGFFQAFAQPINDNVCNATALAIGQTCTGNSYTNIGATKQTNEPTSCFGDNTVWFTFVAPTNGSVDIQIGSTNSAGFAVFNAPTCNDFSLFTQVVCRYDNPNWGVDNLTPGKTYFIQVSGAFNSEGNFCITLQSYNQPTNDQVCNAYPLSINQVCNTNIFTNIGATFQSGEPSACLSANTVWFSFVAPASGRVDISTTSTNSMGIAVYAVTNCNSFASFTRLICAYDNPSVILDNLTAGNTYYIQASGAFMSEGNFCIQLLSGPPPLNDNCSDAITLSVNSALVCNASLSGTTAWATQSLVSCYGGNRADDDVWYQFTATAASHVISVTNSNDPKFEVYSGNCASLVSIGGCLNDGGGTSEEHRLLGLTPGQTYFVRVYTYGYRVSATFDICIKTPPPPPVNDNCAEAITLPVLTGSDCAGQGTFGATDWATQSLPGCIANSFADDDVWYKFTATAASHVINVSNANDPKFEVYSGTCGNLTSLGCLDAGGGSSEEHRLLGLTPSQTYFIRIYTYPNRVFSVFDICITTPPPPPANDNCAAAIDVTVNPAMLATNSVAGNTAWATQSQTSCASGGNADDDVWYRFTATATTHLLLVSNASNDPRMQVFSGTCGALVSLACSNWAGSSYESLRLSNLTVGQSYYVRIFTYNTAYTTFDFAILTPPAVSPNDVCGNATSVPINPDLACTTVVNSTTAGAISLNNSCTSGGYDEDDVWYTFVATATTHIITVSNAINPVFQLYSGTCTGLSSLFCQNSDSDAEEQRLVSGLTIGQTYYLRVYSYADYTYMPFTLCITTPPPAPANDNCAGAIALAVNSAMNCNAPTGGNTAGATQSQSGCTGTADDDVWFQFLATATTHLLTVQNGTDPVFQVFSGTCSSLSSVICQNGDANGVEFKTLTGLTIGQIYYVRVYSFQNLVFMPFAICVSTPATSVTNDECANAVDLTINADLNCGNVTLGTTAGATESLPGCEGAAADDDVWYKFVASSVSHRVKLSAATQDMTMEIYSGSCANPMSLICLDPWPFGSATNIEHQLNGLTVGQTYYVRAFTRNNLAYGNFTLCIGTPPAPPANNECAGAATLTVNADLSCGSALQGSTAGATESLPGCEGAAADDDVWYKFVASSVSHRVRLSEATQDMTMEIYSGSCANPMSLICLDPWPYGSATNIEHQLNGLTVGQTYYVRTFTRNNLAYGNFTLCIGTPPAPPANNECAGAATLTVNADLSCGSALQGSTAGATESLPGCEGVAADDDVWYKFVASSVSHRVRLSEATQDMTMEIYSGTCANPMSLICLDPWPFGSATNIEHQLNGLTVGQTYYVRTFTRNNLAYGNFTLCIGTPPAPPSNNECAGAATLTVNADLSCESALQGSTAGATESLPGCEGVAADDDVWYKFVASSVSHRVRLSEATQDMTMEIYLGTCANPMSLICLDPWPFGSATNIEHQLNGLTVGQTYYVRTFTRNNLAYGNFTLCIGTPPAPPANNECAGAATLTVNADLSCGSALQGSTAGATESLSGCEGVAADDDVWYKFVASSVSHRVKLSAATQDMTMEIYSGTCANPMSLICLDPWPFGSATNIEHQLNGLTVGQTYYVRAFTRNNLAYGNFTLCIGTPPAPPSNNECAGAATLTVNADLSCESALQGSTAGATESLPGCEGVAADDDVWYKFVASSVSHRVRLSEATQDMTMEIYSGTCANPMSLICLDPWPFGSATNIEHQLNGLTVGQTYYVRTFTRNNLAYGNFTLCVGTPPAPPANNECAGAATLTVNADLSCESALQGSTAGATESLPGCEGAAADDDVWYKFVASSVSHRVKLSAATQDMTMEIYSGTCANPMSLICLDPWPFGSATNIEHQLNGLTVGQTYYVRTFTRNNLAYGNFTLCIGTPPAPPANNECAGAATLTVNADLSCESALQGSTAGATESLPGCEGAAADDDVWYKFVASSVSHRVKLGAATQDMTMEIYSGTCANPMSLICLDPWPFGSATNIEHQLNGLTVGQTYYVRTFTRNNLAYGNFTLCIGTPPAPPANNECAGAATLTVNADLSCGSALQGSTAGATESLSGCEGAAADDDVWYKFVASSVSHRVKLSAATQDMTMEIYSGSCANPMSLICLDPWPFGSATNIEYQLNGLTVGQTYYVRAFTRNNLAYGNFTLCIGTPPAPPANNECANATLLSVSPTRNCTTKVSGTTIGATRSRADCNGISDDDVWYRFDATATAQTITVNAKTNVSNPLPDVAFELFSGNCSNLTSLRCENSQWGQGTEVFMAQGLTIGQVYYIRVYGASGDLDSWGQFEICITTPAIPVNDNCASAINLTVSSTASCTNFMMGTTVDATRAAEANCGQGVDVWYKFVATNANQAVALFSTGAASSALENPSFELYNGSCATLNSIGCVNDYSGNETEQRIFKDLTVGNTYYVRVFSQNAALDAQGTFEVCVSTPAIPANDDCTGATHLSVGTGGLCNIPMTGTTIYATGSASTACSGQADDDVWYKFTAISDAHTIQVRPIGTASEDLNNPVMEVFSGTCSNLSRIHCVDQYWNQNMESVIASDLVVGQEYFVRVYSDNFGAANSGTFEMCVFTAFNLVRDLAIASMELPLSGCNLQADETVRVKVRNFGNADQTGVQIGFQVDNGPLVSENMGGLLIPALGVVTYTFNNKANLSALGGHTLKVFPMTSIDNNRLNDTLLSNLQHLPGIGAPGSLLPANGTTNLDLPLTLSWSAVPNATSYDLFRWIDGAMPPVDPSLTTTATSATFSSGNLAFDQTYRWKVSAKARGCSDNFSVDQTFGTKQKPDLTVTNAVVLSAVFAGQTATVQFRINNIGPGETGRYGWYDIVYLASEPNLTAAGTLIRLKTENNQSALNAGQFYQQSLEIEIPSNLLGTYYLVVTTNKSWMTMEEVNTANNESVAIPLLIQAPPGPDLAPQAVQFNPSVAFSEDNITVNYNTLNIGNAQLTGSRVDRIYLSNDQTFSPASDFLLGSFATNTAIPAGQSVPVSRTVALPVGISGNWYVFVQLDATNTIPEGLNEGNNTSVAGSTLSVILKPPIDLVVQNVVYPLLVQPNQNVQLNWAVKNQGGSATNGAWTIKISLAPAGNGQNGTLLRTLTHNTVLQPDGVANFSANVTIPYIAQDTVWYIAIEVDAGNSQFEYIFENNNLFTAAVQVRVPDMRPGQTTFPPLVSGQSPVVNFPAINDGMGALYNYGLDFDLYLDVSANFNPATAIRIGNGVQQIPLLLPTDTQIIQTTLQIPDGIFGAYKLYTVLDESNTIPESNETNNTSFVSVNITLADYPNLLVQNLNAPANAQAGDNLSVSYQLRNNGPGNVVNRNWVDRIYLSPTPVFNPATGVLLKTVEWSAVSIAANAHLAHTAVMVLPENTTAGNYYIAVVADAGNAIYEFTNENDNTTISSGLSVAAYPNTDLLVSSANVDPSSLVSGQSLTINWTVQNPAASPTPATALVEDAIFLSVDNQINPGDIRIGTLTRTSRIAAASNNPHTLILTTPSGLSGLYYVLVATDFNQAAYDNNRANNVRAADPPGGIQPPRINFVLPPLVDLNITAYNLPVEGTAGQPVDLQYIVQNSGPATSTAARWLDAAYLSQDPVVGYGDPVLFNREVRKVLAPGATYDTTANIFLPLSAVGNYQAILRTDHTQQQYEHLAENNNEATRSIVVIPALPCDLSATNATAPATAIVGNMATVTWQLHNTGANPAKGYIREAVYWSNDTIWDSNDILAGLLTTSNLDLVPGTNLNRSLNATVQGLLPGNWYAIVRVDIQNNHAESNEDNNSRCASAPTAVDISELLLNVNAAIASAPAQQTFYKLVVPPALQGETIRIEVTGEVSNTTGNEIYTSFGVLPSLAAAQYRANTPFNSMQKLYIPAADSGTYYIMVRDSRLSGSAQNISVLAQVLPFQIVSIDAAKGGNTGKVTIRLVGSKFEASMGVQLQSATLGIRTAENIHYVNPNIAFATFNLSGATLGFYNVVATKTSGSTTTLPNAFEIVAGTPPSDGNGSSSSVVCTVSFSDGDDALAVLAQAPPTARARRSFLITVAFENASNIDLPAQQRIFMIKEGQGRLSFDPAVFANGGGGTSLLLDLKEENGPPGIIRPGAGGIISFYAMGERGIPVLDYFLTQ